ncbi:hypothetical protein D9757_001459 [Collybiopsis confluens]|uniref:Uncharacterized protein n=1 Tax=Collybiopsis confluens TaxID=2823264 RepID=A0A8H5HZH7_9AGAR|nr:hypothetical protein D9757_001459 [Collybiopsis confluens]
MTSVVGSTISSTIFSSNSTSLGLNARTAFLMDTIFSIVFGLSLRYAITTISNSSLKITGSLIGIWEGVVLSHFTKKWPRSYDPYIACAARMLVDFFITDSIARLLLILLWTGVGMVMAEVSPGIWKDSGARRVWSRFKRDMRVVRRSLPIFHLPRVAIPTLYKPRTVRFRTSSAASASSAVSGPTRSAVSGPTRSVVSTATAPATETRTGSRHPTGTPAASVYSTTTTSSTSTSAGLAPAVSIHPPTPGTTPTPKKRTRVPGHFRRDSETETDIFSSVNPVNPITLRQARIPYREIGSTASAESSSGLTTDNELLSSSRSRSRHTRYTLFTTKEADLRLTETETEDGSSSSTPEAPATTLPGPSAEIVEVDTTPVVTERTTPIQSPRLPQPALPDFENELVLADSTSHLPPPYQAPELPKVELDPSWEKVESLGINTGKENDGAGLDGELMIPPRQPTKDRTLELLFQEASEKPDKTMSEPDWLDDFLGSSKKKRMEDWDKVKQRSQSVVLAAPSVVPDVTETLARPSRTPAPRGSRDSVSKDGIYIPPKLSRIFADPPPPPSPRLEEEEEAKETQVEEKSTVGAEDRSVIDSVAPSQAPEPIKLAPRSKAPSEAPAPAHVVSKPQSRAPSVAPSKAHSRAASVAPSKAPSQAPETIEPPAPSPIASKFHSRAASIAPSKAPSQAPEPIEPASTTKTPAPSEPSAPSHVASKFHSRAASIAPSKAPSQAPEPIEPASTTKTPAPSEPPAPSHVASKSHSRAASIAPSKAPSQAPEPVEPASTTKTPAPSEPPAPSPVASKSHSRAASIAPSKAPSQAPEPLERTSTTKTPAPSEPPAPSPVASKAHSRAASQSPQQDESAPGPLGQRSTPAPSEAPSRAPSQAPSPSEVPESEPEVESDSEVVRPGAPISEKLEVTLELYKQIDGLRKMLKHEKEKANGDLDATKQMQMQVRRLERRLNRIACTEIDPKDSNNAFELPPNIPPKTAIERAQTRLWMLMTNKDTKGVYDILEVLTAKGAKGKPHKSAIVFAFADLGIEHEEDASNGRLVRLPIPYKAVRAGDSNS